VRALGDATVEITLGDARAEVPRHWLARMLFRVALHGYRLGRVETYGGFAIDDRGEDLALSLPGAAPVRFPRRIVEPLYRAVAPPGYAEVTR
jgi:hypothetical protein